jgi:CrcB protein
VFEEISAAGDATIPRVERRQEARGWFRKRRGLLVVLLALGCGGAVGAIARYAVTLALPISDGRFPWNTFLINVSGSLLLGFLLILMTEQFPRGRLVRIFFGTGVIGAFTTFSTFEVDALLLFRGHHVATGLWYVAASVAAGLVALWLGIAIARLLIRVEQWLQGEMA